MIMSGGKRISKASKFQRATILYEKPENNHFFDTHAHNETSALLYYVCVVCILVRKQLVCSSGFHFAAFSFAAFQRDRVDDGFVVSFLLDDSFVFFCCLLLFVQLHSWQK